MERELKTPLKIAGLDFEPDSPQKLLVGEELQQALCILLGMSKDKLVPIRSDPHGHIFARPLDLCSGESITKDLADDPETDLGGVYEYHIGYAEDSLQEIGLGNVSGVIQSTVYPKQVTYAEVGGVNFYVCVYEFWANCRYLTQDIIDPIGGHALIMTSYRFPAR